MSRIGLSPGWFARRLARTICHGTCRHCFSRARTAERHSARSVQRETRRTLGGAAIGCGISAAVFRVCAYRGTALRPIRSTSELVGSLGELRSAAVSRLCAHRDQALRLSPFNAILFARGPWGEASSLVARVRAHRKRASFYTPVFSKTARNAPARAGTRPIVRLAIQHAITQVHEQGGGRSS